MIWRGVFGPWVPGPGSVSRELDPLARGIASSACDLFCDRFRKFEVGSVGGLL
jgi:hypothetical protein